MDSSRTHDSIDSSNDDNSIVDNTMNVDIVNTASTGETQNELLVTEFPQSAITRTPQSPSPVQMLDPQPPYPTDSNMHIPTPSHSRDHTTITLTSPPEYTVITTQPQPKVMSRPSNHIIHSNISIAAEETPILSPSEQLKFCKICQEPEESDSSEEDFVKKSETYNKGKLISPCRCKGSLQYVHIGCLNKWRHSNVRLEASYRCEVCKYEYRF